MEIKKKPVFLIDMDGTLYKGTAPILYAKEFIKYLQEKNRKFLLVTNCPGSSADELVQKLACMEIEVAANDILTAGRVTASFVSNANNCRVYLIGSNALEEELINAGLQIVNHKPECVVVGFDRNFSYEKMEQAIEHINNGAKFIITNGDYTIPEGDKLIPHTGALAAGIEKATGVKPLVMGKPEKYILDTAQKLLSCDKEEICIIGDRLDTDIAMGCNFGIDSYLVMTGVTTYNLLENSTVKPTRIFHNLHEVMIFDSERC